MSDFLMTWGTAIGIFLVTGTFMQAMNLTIGGKAGDHGLKGFWYVWKRFLLIILGVLDSMLAWRGGFAISDLYVLLLASGIFVYFIGAVQRRSKS